MKKITKTKYYIAVAICFIAAAFSSCANDEETDMYSLDSQELSEYGTVTDSEEDADTEAVREEDTGNNETETGETAAADSKFVYVCGAVKNPGVYELDSDARVVDFIEAAGGMLKNAASEYLNLAAVISDGEKVYVPTYDEIAEVIDSGSTYANDYVSITDRESLVLNESADVSGSDTGDNAGTASADSGKVNINTADVDTLMTLPGVGEAKAAKIIEYREENGGFSSTEDIMLISGIKEGMYNKIKDSICVK